MNVSASVGSSRESGHVMSVRTCPTPVYLTTRNTELVTQPLEVANLY